MRTGRPPLPADQRRSVRLPILLTEAERATLGEAAEKAGTDVTTFVREAALAKAKRAR